VSNVSVVIPIGPYEANKRWLQECLESAVACRPDEIILIDDGAGLHNDELDWLDTWHYRAIGEGYQCDQYLAYGVDISVYPMPWRTGISHAFNYGVMLARNNLVFMLGSDDTLEPSCLGRCTEAWEANKRADAYYSVPIKYMDTGEVQTAPCNAAMVTKGFWRLSGGFPIETAIGIGDSTLLSICLAHKLPVQWVGALTGHDEEPLYNYRRHPDIHTYKIPWGIADPLRNHLTGAWSPDEVKLWSERY
jgi:glycosyltransferase involved in cell wall biosynthesis